MVGQTLKVFLLEIPKLLNFYLSIAKLTLYQRCIVTLGGFSIQVRFHAPGNMAEEEKGRHLKGVQSLWMPPLDGDLLQIPGENDLSGE